jgi:hypothetical protein
MNTGIQFRPSQSEKPTARRRKPRGCVIAFAFAIYALFVWLIVPPWWSLVLLSFGGGVFDGQVYRRNMRNNRVTHN